MCIIIENSKGLPIDPFVADKATTINPDGYTRLDLRTMEVIKTLDMNKAERIMRENVPAVHHARYATVGKVSLDNLHPFDVEDGWLLFMNGTVEGMKCVGNETDTARLAQALSWVAPELYPQFLANFDARFTLVHKDTKKVINVGDFLDHGGMKFSKADVLPSQLVAVYGTLKHGFGNNYLLKRGGAKFWGGGFTVDKHRMPDWQTPVVFKGTNAKGEGAAIKVEVYEVTTGLLEGDLDHLEGHPHWYKREKVKVFLTFGNRVETCWLYFMRENGGDRWWGTDTGGPYYSEYGVRPRVGYGTGMVKSAPVGSFTAQVEEEDPAQLSILDDPDMLASEVERVREILRDGGLDGDNWEDEDIEALIAGGFAKRPQHPCRRCGEEMEVDDNWVWCDMCGHYEHISRHDRTALADRVSGL